MVRHAAGLLRVERAMESNRPRNNQFENSHFRTFSNKFITLVKTENHFENNTPNILEIFGVLSKMSTKILFSTSGYKSWGGLSLGEKKLRKYENKRAH